MGKTLRGGGPCAHLRRMDAGRLPPLRCHPRTCSEDPSLHLLRCVTLDAIAQSTRRGNVLNRGFSRPIGMRRGQASPRMTNGESIRENIPLSPCLLRHGERVRVRGRSWAQRKRLPLTPALSPLAGRGGSSACHSSRAPIARVQRRRGGNTRDRKPRLRPRNQSMAAVNR
jgi:hypothetical protein